VWILMLAVAGGRVAAGGTSGVPARVSSVTAAVQVTGRLLEFNGTRDVPRGLFGVHATPLTAERVSAWGIEAERRLVHAPVGALPASRQTPLVCECFYDRYQPALAVSRPADYVAFLKSLGADCGAAAAASPVPRWIEFWNEPYLNWGIQPGVNYDGTFYDGRDTTPGRPMTLRGESNALPDLVWRRQVVAVNSSGRVHYVASRYIPAGLGVSNAFTWSGRTFTTEERPWGRDVSQSNFWAGRQNRAFYEAMLVPFAQSLKAANSNVTLIAGWGFHIHQDNWKAWRELHRPLLDVAWRWIDGYGEHHYGGDTRGVAGSYETAWAYALTTHGKRLKFYNTEAGGMVDPEQPGVVRNRAEGARGAEGALVYMLRDILHLLSVCPDKAAARFAHEAAQSGGEELAFRLLKPLRGRLVECVSSLGTVWCVSAVENGRLGLVLFNDAAQGVEVALSVAAPRGSRLADGGSLLVTHAETLALATNALPARGTLLALPVTLGARQSATYWFDLEGRLDEAEVTRVTQFPAAALLSEVKPDLPASLAITLPAGLRARARMARLRFVQEGLSGGLSGGAVCTVNGRALPLVISGSYTCEQPVPLDWLADTNRLVFACAPGMEGGYRLCTASLMMIE
jgi:hypothetical protein